MGWDYNYSGGKTPEEELAERGYEFQFEYGYWDYDWQIHKVYTKDGRVFELSDGGCSCTSFGENWNSIDEAIGQMVELSRLPSVESLSKTEYGTVYDDKGEITQEKFRDLGLR